MGTSNKHIPLASAHKRKLSEEGKQKIILNIPQAINTFHLHPHTSASSTRLRLRREHRTFADLDPI